MNLLDLPDIVLLQIFEQLSYEEVSKKRLVCGKIDRLCQHILNRGFNKVIHQHAVILKRIKALLPRRESERRNHCMARHADILGSIETRISMLSMTYTKYIDLDLCCFIPGRVLDEILRILRLISNTVKPLRAHEVLQELRDISSMAIEHFDENIAGTLKRSYHMYSKNTRMCNPAEANKSKVTFFSKYLDDKTNILLLKGCGSESSSIPLQNATMPDFIVERTSALQNTTNSGRLSSISSTANSESSTMSSNLQLPSKSLYASTPLKATGSVGSCQIVQILNGIRGEANSELKFPEAVNVDNENEAGEHSYECPGGKAAVAYFKKIEVEYKKGIVKMQQMQQIQTQQSRRLQQALASVAELNVQVIELRKRLEDVDAKNREITANIKQINTGEPITATTSSSATQSNSPVAAAEAAEASISVASGKPSRTCTRNIVYGTKSGQTSKKTENDILVGKFAKRIQGIKKEESSKTTEDVSVDDDLPSAAKKMKY